MESKEYVGAEPTCSTKSPVEVVKGDCIQLKNKPCKIFSIAVFKTGKHGGAKYHFGGYDLFSGKKCEELYMGHQKVACSEVLRTQLVVVNLDRDGYATLMDGKTLSIREDLQITDEEMREAIHEEIKKDKEVTVTVLSVDGNEQIIEYVSK
jgi:translation initiation factor 5A